MTEKSWIEEKYKDIEYNLKTIREEIAKAAALSGRSEKDIDFMAVTKTVDEMFINHAIDCGITLIGENKVQEMLRKKPNLHLDGVRKNLIGHLQSNKASQIVGEVDMIESVDSLKIAREISKQALKKGIVQDVLVEVNTGAKKAKPESCPNASKICSGKWASAQAFASAGLWQSRRFVTIPQNFVNFLRICTICMLTLALKN